MITGRVFAAKPRPASQTSPGRWSIENVQDVLLDRTRTKYIESVLIGQGDDLGDAVAHVRGRLWLPFTQFGIQRFDK